MFCGTEVLKLLDLVVPFCAKQKISFNVILPQEVAYSSVFSVMGQFGQQVAVSNLRSVTCVTAYMLPPRHSHVPQKLPQSPRGETQVNQWLGKETGWSPSSNHRETST